MPASSSAFQLPDRLAVKRDPALIDDDERRFAAIALSLRRSIADLDVRLNEQRRMPGRSGQEALERDAEIRRLERELRTLRRFGLDACLGRIVRAGEPEPIYIGRFGLTDAEGERLLIDWRVPASEPFFAATHAHPMGVVSRRRYRWTAGRVSDYWDEVFDPELLGSDAGALERAALDDQSAFIASLGSARSERMRDVLGTIQADQDAIIRAGSRGALVVDGGPGTGKTVVALHRTAYLLYSDPRLGHRRGGVLFVGPSEGYLAYVDDVLPSLGEEGVRICTVRDLVPEGADAVDETDARVAALKASPALEEALDAAVRHYERAPRGGAVETRWGDVPLSAGEWAEAFEAAEPGATHNEAREQVWEQLVQIVADRLGEEADPHAVDGSMRTDGAAREVFDRSWPLLDPAGVLADLWSVPAYLRACAPALDADGIRLLQRAEPRSWTTSDLPLLDAARRRIGDPAAARTAQRAAAAEAAQREEMSAVVDELVASMEMDDGEGVMKMLTGEDLREKLVDASVLPTAAPDALAGPFAHIVVDEAQELTDAEWRMLLRRCPSRSFTIAGDRAQARRGFAESWEERLHRVGVDTVTLSSLTVNYRTPAEVMAVAEPVIRAVLPDANVPVSVRSGGPVVRRPVTWLTAVVEEWLAETERGERVEGVAAVIRTAERAHAVDAAVPSSPRVRAMSPAASKGLEFDLVVLVEPQGFGEGIEGGVDRYVAMTRATQRLVLLG